MNTSSADMDVVGERSSFVFAKTEAAGGSGTSAPATAVGVFNGLRAAVAHAFGTDDLAGRTVSVQGVGAVGEPLARELAEHGARLVLTDVDDVRAKELAQELDAETAGSEEIYDAECDVFAPCATGRRALAGDDPAAPIRVIAGAANNQLAEPEDADRLAERGILYAPDYVVNAGGMIHLASLEMLGEDVAARDERLQGIGGTLADVFALAERRGISTAAAADAIVEERLVEGRA